jgi:hypothetical protein
VQRPTRTPRSNTIAEATRRAVARLLLILRSTSDSGSLPRWAVGAARVFGCNPVPTAPENALRSGLESGLRSDLSHEVETADDTVEHDRLRSQSTAYAAPTPGPGRSSRSTPRGSTCGCACRPAGTPSRLRCARALRGALARHGLRHPHRHAAGDRADRAV